MQLVVDLSIFLKTYPPHVRLLSDMGISRMRYRNISWGVQDPKLMYYAAHQLYRRWLEFKSATYCLFCFPAVKHQEIIIEKEEDKFKNATQGKDRFWSGGMHDYESML